MLLKQAEVAPGQFHIPLAVCLSLCFLNYSSLCCYFEDFQRYMSNAKEAMITATWLSKLNNNSRSRL